MPADPMEMTNPGGPDRRVEHIERRQDRLEAQVTTMGEVLGKIDEKLSGFLREYNQGRRTDWKTILAAAGVLVTLGVAAVGGMAWLIMTVEGLRSAATNERITAEIAAREAADVTLAGELADAEAHRAEILRLVIEEHRRDVDAIESRLQRLEDRAMGGPG